MKLWSPNESGCSRTCSETPHERNTPIDVINNAYPAENLVLEEIPIRSSPARLPVEIKSMEHSILGVYLVSVGDQHDTFCTFCDMLLHLS